MGQDGILQRVVNPLFFLRRLPIGAQVTNGYQPALPKTGAGVEDRTPLFLFVGQKPSTRRRPRQWLPSVESNHDYAVNSGALYR